jgi:hypothetical protein
VKQRRLPAFRAERVRFELRFTCEHCTYFDPERERCTHGYPTAEHRDARYREPAAPEQGPQEASAGVEARDSAREQVEARGPLCEQNHDELLVFCKEFELM